MRTMAVWINARNVDIEFISIVFQRFFGKLVVGSFGHFEVDPFKQRLLI